MNPARFRSPLLAGSALMMMSFPLPGQRLEPPRYRPQDAPARAARVLESISHDPTLRTAQRIIVDTTLGGAVWIKFAPTALPRTAWAPTARAAAASFLSRYGAQVFGIGPAEESLELLAERQEGRLTHFRYGQRHAGYRFR